MTHQYMELKLKELEKRIEALEQEPCEDAISRQAVLDALDKSKYSNEFCEEHHIDWSINLGMAHIVVNELKPVTPQTKTGHWIFTKTIFDKHGCTVECSSCHKKWKTYDEIRWKKENKFCLNCGSRNEVEE